MINNSTIGLSWSFLTYRTIRLRLSFNPTGGTPLNSVLLCRNSAWLVADGEPTARALREQHPVRLWGHIWVAKRRNWTRVNRPEKTGCCFQNKENVSFDCHVHIKCMRIQVSVWGVVWWWPSKGSCSAPFFCESCLIVNKTLVWLHSQSTKVARWQNFHS